MDGYINSKIHCPICNKLLAKNYMKNHLKKQHSNCYGTMFWGKYSQRYKKILEDNKRLYSDNLASSEIGMKQ